MTSPFFCMRIRRITPRLPPTFTSARFFRKVDVTNCLSNIGQRCQTFRAMKHSARNFLFELAKRFRGPQSVASSVHELKDPAIGDGIRPLSGNSGPLTLPVHL